LYSITHKHMYVIEVVNRLCCGYAKYGAHMEDSAGQSGGHINKTQSIRYS
jgi:hypothetical protein